MRGRRIERSGLVTESLHVDTSYESLIDLDMMGSEIIGTYGWKGGG